MATVDFNYDQVKDAKLRQRSRAHAAEIKLLLARTGQSVIEIGQMLQEIRDGLSGAMFAAWLAAEFRWKHPVAFNYMQAARVFGDLDCLAQFQPSAIVALARKNVPASVIDQAIAKARSGETVTWKDTQTLLKASGMELRGPRVRQGKSRGPFGQKLVSTETAQELRTELDRFAQSVSEMTEKLSQTDREAMADQFLRLALQLRGSNAAVTPSVGARPRPRRELASVN